MLARIKQQPVSADTVFYLTRWTDRTPHKNYIKTLEHPYWSDNPGALYIAYHGNSEIDGHAKLARDSGTANLLDFRQYSPHGRFPKLVLGIWDHFLSQKNGPSVCFLVDDDAYYGDPKHAAGMGSFLVREDGAGCGGPIPPFRMMARYKNDMNIGECAEMSGHPWSTFGSQFYARSALSDTRYLWEPYMESAYFSMDIPTFTLFHSHGYRIIEFNTPYSHRSGRVKSVSKDRQWALRNICFAEKDYTATIEMMQQYPNQAEFYLKEQYKRERPLLNFMNQEVIRFLEGEKPFSSFDEMMEFSRNHMEELQ